MKKNAFTLAELLGVIVILALISLITIPSISGTLQKYKKNLCDAQLNQIISAARNWGADNILSLPSDGGTKKVTVSTLAKYGYIDDEIKNPVTGENFNLKDIEIIITRTGKKYNYSLDDKTKNACNSE